MALAQSLAKTVILTSPGGCDLLYHVPIPCLNELDLRGVNLIFDFQDTLLTAGDDACQLSSIPDDINSVAIEDNGESVSNRTANITITKDEETTNYELNISEGEISEEEKGNMTETMRTACGDKVIEKITVRSTSADQFELLANGGIISLPVTNQRNRQKRQIVSGCSNFKVK